MFYSWGFLIDISLILVRNFKCWRNYVIIHGLIQLFIDVATVILVSLTIYVNTYPMSEVLKGVSGVHFVVGASMLILTVLMHIQGLIL